MPRVNPDSSREAARFKVTKLEKALEVMGDADGPVVECLKGELEKARNVTKRRPLQQEVEECRKFTTLSEKRISELDTERQSEMKALDEVKNVWCRWKPSRQKSQRSSDQCSKPCPLWIGLQRSRDYERN